jgi:peptidoglycan-associated lipoprotein
MRVWKGNVMMRSIMLPLAVAALGLAACASRPPDSTAGTPPPTATPPAASTPAAERGTANASSAPGGPVASGPAAPGEHAVYFEFDSSALSQKAQGVIQQNARYVQPRSAHVRLEGNADERGSREYNLALGQRRAEAVRQAMVLDGVRADALEAVSNGEERPRCSEHTEECYATNRRVDILVAP